MAYQRPLLKDRLAGRVVHGRNPGPEPYLSNEEEKELSTFLNDVCKMGHGKTKQEVLFLVKKVLDKKERSVQSFNGEGWWNKFMQRHPELSLRTADPLSYSRSNALTQEMLDHYFTLLKKTLTNNHILDMASVI